MTDAHEQFKADSVRKRRDWSSFRITVENKIEGAFEQIGFEGDPEVFLIGFSESGLPEWIESDLKSFTLSHLQDVPHRSKILYTQHPQYGSFWDNEWLHEVRHAAYRDESRGEAIKEALSSVFGESRTLFVSLSAPYGTQQIMAVISVDGWSLSRVPALKSLNIDGMRIAPSLVNAIIDEVFTRSRRMLQSSDLYHEGDTPELVRVAASRFVRDVLVRAGNWMASRTNGVLSTVSSLPYEGRAGSGRIVIGKIDHESIDVYLKLKNTVSIEDIHGIRKLVEASGSEGDLLSDGDLVFGFGRVKPDYDTNSEKLFAVNIVDRGAWELCHAGTSLLVVRDGNPRLPSAQLDLSYLHEIIERSLPGADILALVRIAEAIGNHAHGAMLIISGEAQEEAARLTPQAWAIEPTPVSSDLLVQLTEMDGGVLVDAHGLCHAIGVILDGRACGNESPARGSRYNNAVRYIHSDAPKAVVIVYSTDGQVDILPRLYFRLSMKAVDAAVKKYLELATPPPGKDGLAKAWRDIQKIRFYLSEEQCLQVNEARRALDAWRQEHGLIVVIVDDFVPDPGMNHSYWLLEDVDD